MISKITFIGMPVSQILIVNFSKIKTLLILTALINIALVNSSLAQDLIITDNVIFEDTSIVLNGDLIVRDGGILTLNSATIEMNCQFDGQYRVFVDTSASFFMLNHSELTKTENGSNYAFVCNGREFKMLNSILSGVGWGVFEELNVYPDDGSKGAFITSPSAIIDSSEIIDCHTGLILACDSAIVTNNQIHSFVIGGIKLFTASHALIKNNWIKNDEAMGLIEARGGYGNQIINNQLISPYIEGATQCIRMGSTHNYIIDGNHLETGGIAIWLWACDDNTIINNTVNAGENAIIIWGWNNRVENNTFDNYLEWYGDPIYMTFAYNTQVINNRILNVGNSDNSGIWLRHSSNNLIMGNDIDVLPRNHFQNKSRGIFITESSRHNILHSNNINGSSYGIFMSYSSNDNKLYNNEITDIRFHSIVIDDADSNFVYSNNSMTNIGLVPFDDGENYWDYSGAEPELSFVSKPKAANPYGKRIAGQEVIENQTINFHFAELAEGASLIIRNSTLIMGIDSSDMSYIAMQPNSTLEVYDSKILHHEYGGGFTIDAGGGASNYILKNSEIRGAGHEWWYCGNFIMTDNSDIENCTFYETSIIFQDCNGGRFVGNKVYNSYTGILFESETSNMIIEDNIIDGAIRSGISGHGSSTNILIRNNQIKNIWGDGLQGFAFTNSRIENNKIFNINGPFSGINSIGDNSEALNNQIQNSYFGIYNNSENAEIYGNNISQCDIGLLLRVFGQSISSNSITDCNVGIYIDAEHNKINNFVISECDTGIILTDNSRENFIYGNDIIDNGIQAINPDTTNHFDFEGAGNFWSDYYGVDDDSNGIGDTPYYINAAVYDNYPLMATSSYTYDPIFCTVQLEGVSQDQISNGDSNVVITKIVIGKSTADSIDVCEWLGLNLDIIGNVADSDISSIKIWRDINDNSIIEYDIDSLVGSTTFIDSESYVSFFSNEVITATPISYLISLDISENISNDGNSVGIAIKDSTYFRFKFPVKVNNSNFPFHSDEYVLTGINDEQLPTSFSLEQNYPNPFNPTTTIKYSIPAISELAYSESVNSEKAIVKLVIYDILGREVTTLVNENQHPGYYEVKWDATGQASGIYFYKLNASKFSETRKMVLLH